MLDLRSDFVKAPTLDKCQWVTLRLIEADGAIDHYSPIDEIGERFLIRSSILEPPEKWQYEFHVRKHIEKLNSLPNRDWLRQFAGVVPVFDRFASIGFEEACILDFASRYGSLDIMEWGALEQCRTLKMKIPVGMSLESSHELESRPEWYPHIFRALKAGIVYGEPLYIWTDHIAAMNVCVLLFRALLAGDDLAIANAFDCTHKKKAFAKDYPEWYFCESGPGEPDPRNREPRSLAGRFIADSVGNHLSRSGCQMSLNFDADDRSFSFSNYPRTFIDAIWLEFASAIQDVKSFRECAACKHLFRVGDGGSRKSRRTCSAGCRMNLLRDRKLEARELRGRGMHLREIAAKLDTTLKTVSSWCKDVPLP